MGRLEKVVERIVESGGDFDREEFMSEVFGHYPLVPRPVRFGEIEWDDETSYVTAWDDCGTWIGVGHLIGEPMYFEDDGDRYQSEWPDAIWV